jgi:hypothetical protein
MDTQFKLIIGDIVDSDPLTEIEAGSDFAYVDANPETGALPPK